MCFALIFTYRNSCVRIERLVFALCSYMILRSSISFGRKMKPTIEKRMRGERENNYVNKAENKALDTERKC